MLLQEKFLPPEKIRAEATAILRTGKKLSFWGTIDEQYTLPFGTREEVKREVLERIKTMAPGGGFIISPTHHVQLDTPLENFLTFLNTAKEFGRYPIKV